MYEFWLEHFCIHFKQMVGQHLLECLLKFQTQSIGRFEKNCSHGENLHDRLPLSGLRPEGLLCSSLAAKATEVLVAKTNQFTFTYSVYAFSAGGWTAALHEKARSALVWPWKGILIAADRALQRNREESGGVTWQ